MPYKVVEMKRGQYRPQYEGKTTPTSVSLTKEDKELLAELQVQLNTNRSYTVVKALRFLDESISNATYNIN